MRTMPYNERLFHWQSQSSTSQDSPTGQRYINYLNTGNKIGLFVREHKLYSGLTSPYIYINVTKCI